MAITESQKAYEKKRSKECKTYAIKYSPVDIKESNRLQVYLKENKITPNSYIKQLIKQDLDNKGIPYPEAELQTGKAEE